MSDDFGVLLDDLKKWKPGDKLDDIIAFARTSLAEVKGLTEYEDGKVSRLLTIVAFLSAVVAAVFTHFATDYAWPTLIVSSLHALLAAATYVTFFLYVTMITYSVMTLISAIKPTFNEPKSWKGASSAEPGSMLFYARILDVSPSKWGKIFIDSSATELKERYARSYIAETYLIADKVAKKLKAIEPGINWLRRAMYVLFAFFMLVFLTTIIVPPTKTASGVSERAQTIKPVIVPVNDQFN